CNSSKVRNTWIMGPDLPYPKPPALLLVLIALSSGTCWGMDRPSDLTLFINPGVATGTLTDSTYRLASGTLLQTTHAVDEVSRLFELEVSYALMKYFAV